MQLKNRPLGLPVRAASGWACCCSIQKPPGPPVSPAAGAQTRACWHAFRLARTGWVTRDSRWFLPHCLSTTVRSNVRSGNGISQRRDSWHAEPGSTGSRPRQRGERGPRLRPPAHV